MPYNRILFFYDNSSHLSLVAADELDGVIARESPHALGQVLRGTGWELPGRTVERDESRELKTVKAK